jgi:hypothetical protein
MADATARQRQERCDRAAALALKLQRLLVLSDFPRATQVNQTATVRALCVECQRSSVMLP